MTPTGGTEGRDRLRQKRFAGISCGARRLPGAGKEGLEDVLDLAEGTVFKAVTLDPNIALRFLDLRGRSRGYTRRTEVTGKDGAELQPPTIVMSPADLKQ